MEIKVKEYRNKIDFALLRLPNLLHESVPFGEDDSENVVMKFCGNPPEFGFKPKNHLEIALNLGLIDVKRAAKVAGHGFVYLKEELALLDYAILPDELDHQILLLRPVYWLTRRFFFFRNFYLI